MDTRVILFVLPNKETKAHVNYGFGIVTFELISGIDKSQWQFMADLLLAFCRCAIAKSRFLSYTMQCWLPAIIQDSGFTHLPRRQWCKRSMVLWLQWIDMYSSLLILAIFSCYSYSLLFTLVVLSSLSFPPFGQTPEPVTKCFPDEKL